jgi:hypothetical protein
MAEAGSSEIVKWLQTSDPYLRPLAERVYLAMIKAKHRR